jgi:Arc/MetJ-type ribon-helix-helix transcriptional regulator
MATEAASFPLEIEAITAPLIASGKFANTNEVVHAAIDALLLQLDGQAYDEFCERAAEEGEASGIAEGDVIAQLRAKHGFGAPVAK